MEPTLEEIISALASATPMGAAVDEPEGSRYVQLSTTYRDTLVAGLQAHATEHAHLSATLEEGRTVTLTAQRTALAESLLAEEEGWQTQDTAMNDEFRAEVTAAATAAADDDSARDTVLAMVGKRQKLLGHANNTPIIQGGKPFEQPALTKAQHDDIQAARRDAGLVN